MRWHVLIVGLLLLAACQPENDNIRIGVLAPLTGGAADLGEDMRRGIEMAQEHLGTNYQLVYEDTQCINTKMALSAGQKLANIDDVKHIIGPLCTPPYMALSGIMNENEVLFIHTSGSTAQHERAAGMYGIAGLTASQDAEMEFLAQEIRAQGIDRIALISWNQEWAQQYRLAFISAFEEAGGKIVKDELFDLDASEFDTEVLKATSNDAQGAVVIGLNSQAGPIVQQLKLLRPGMRIFGQLDNHDPAFWKAVGTAGEGMSWALPQLDQDSEFAREYRTRYSEEPSYYSYVGYDSLALVHAAIQSCDRDSLCAAEYIRNRRHPGVSGDIWFIDGIVQREFKLVTLREGVPG